MGNFNAFGDRYLCLSWENDFFDNCLLQKQNQYTQHFFYAHLFSADLISTVFFTIKHREEKGCVI